MEDVIEADQEHETFVEEQILSLDRLRNLCNRSINELWLTRLMRCLLAKSAGVDKVSMLEKGIFLVRFLTVENRDKIAGGKVLFDYKPVCLKGWESELEVNKEDFKIVPIWVDPATANRERLKFSKVVVKKPAVCSYCKVLGHTDEACGRKAKKQGSRSG
ncbi:2 3 4 5-tetrahydropyridine-2 6-dicarboxylate N-succinyltransferase [Bienertia sinuspersici]